MPTDTFTVPLSPGMVYDLGGILNTMALKNFGPGVVTVRFQSNEKGFDLDSGAVLEIEAEDTSTSNPSKVVTEKLFLVAGIATSVSLVWTTKGG